MKINQFSFLINKWYKYYGRKNLPWQINKNIYTVWLSEIMLQQTKVITVIPYFKKFILYFPNITTLANASLNEVLYLWTGLGYYARARNLHKTAKIITLKYKGKFPTIFEEVINLPGIGRSTAGAILSLSDNQYYPILDGNVKRILTRCYAIEDFINTTKTENKLWEISKNLTPIYNSGKFNQAMMDLGSIVCTRIKPKCEMCPINIFCIAYINKTWERYPKKNIKKKILKKTIYFLLLQYNQYIWLEQQSKTGIWGGLFCFPKFNTQSDLEFWIKKYNIKYNLFKKLNIFHHKFSHFYLNIIPIQLKINIKINNINESQKGLWYNLIKPSLLGIPTPVNYFLQFLKKQF
ncbi:A/G-specific adenine glycosylase [Serratia symbiotica]|nr:A/G-specific adenine glycosylase [Serratia symbiotica]